MHYGLYNVYAGDMTIVIEHAFRDRCVLGFPTLCLAFNVRMHHVQPFNNDRLEESTFESVQVSKTFNGKWFYYGS